MLVTREVDWLTAYLDLLGQDIDLSLCERAKAVLEQVKARGPLPLVFLNPEECARPCILAKKASARGIINNSSFMTYSIPHSRPTLLTNLSPAARTLGII